MTAKPPTPAERGVGTHEVVGRVLSIENHNVTVEGCIQILRYGHDTICNIKAGDLVRCTYGRTSYGQGWTCNEVIEHV